MTKPKLSGIYHRAELYDEIYRGRGKDYQTDSTSIAKHIFELNGSASSLLDVACGTGTHLKHLAGLFPHVEGLDLAPDMVRIARDKLPGVPVHQGDMSAFSLDRTFDAITCLFSSIGYLSGTEQLDAALRCFAGHLAPGGVIVLEPWYFPENATSGSVVGDLVTAGERKISRLSRSVRVGDVHHMDVHYLVADSDSGIRHFTDTHVLSLFERRQYESAFTKAGCAVRYLSSGEASWSGPGLFIGVKPRIGG